MTERPRGLTPQERAIMVLWDNSHSMQQIARALEIGFDRVRRTVTYYDGRTDQRDDRKAMIIGSACLADAIRRARVGGQL